MAQTEKITIGFQGAALSLRLSGEALDALLEKLPAGGWADVEAEDGTARVNLATVLYVRTERSEHKVGFGV